MNVFRDDSSKLLDGAQGKPLGSVNRMASHVWNNPLFRALLYAETIRGSEDALSREYQPLK